MTCPFEHIKSYLFYKMINFQNLSSEMQIKKFHRYSCLVLEIFNFLYFQHSHDFSNLMSWWVYLGWGVWVKVFRFCSWVFYFKNYITTSQRFIIVTKKWLFYLNIDSLNWRRGGSCIDTQVTLETDKEYKFYLIITQQRTKSTYYYIKKVNKIETKDLLIAICFQHNHWEIAFVANAKEVSYFKF